MLLPLRETCSGKVAAVVEEAVQVWAVLEAQAAGALVAVAAERAAARTLREPVALAATAGPWYWSIDYGSICFD